MTYKQDITAEPTDARISLNLFKFARKVIRGYSSFDGVHFFKFFLQNGFFIKKSIFGNNKTFSPVSLSCQPSLTSVYSSILLNRLKGVKSLACLLICQLVST